MIFALAQFGFGNVGLKAADFAEKNQIIQFGNPLNQLDILTSIDGVVFEDCYPKRRIETIGGTEAAFIDIQDLRKHKSASGRNQDLANLENLEGA
jgi:glutamine cyclotransferase